ncbi:MAG: restriction endonuclease subunit S [Paludibacteraceae bacterium]|nr:restriction endonuclease subunit S [Paludibacteraceae bacterium]
MPTYPTYKLGDVAEIILGQSPESKAYNTKGEGLPFFQGKTEFTDWFPIPNKWCTEPKKIAEPFDVLLSVRAPVGPTNIAKEKCCIGRGLAAIRYADCYKYVLYYLRSVSKYLESKATGTTFSSISGDTIKNLPIPLPPLATQRAIVSRIETLFAELDKAVQHLHTAQQQLKTYRQAVLNHWLNNEDGKWEMVNISCFLDNSCKGMMTGPFGTALKKSEHKSCGIPVLGIENIGEGSFVMPNKIFVTEEKAKELKTFAVKTDDIIISR